MTCFLNYNIVWQGAMRELTMMGSVTTSICPDHHQYRLHRGEKWWTCGLISAVVTTIMNWGQWYWFRILTDAKFVSQYFPCFISWQICLRKVLKSRLCILDGDILVYEENGSSDKSRLLAVICLQIDRDSHSCFLQQILLETRTVRTLTKHLLLKSWSIIF